MGVPVFVCPLLWVREVLVLGVLGVPVLGVVGVLVLRVVGVLAVGPVGVLGVLGVERQWADLCRYVQGRRPLFLMRERERVKVGGQRGTDELGLWVQRRNQKSIFASFP